MLLGPGPLGAALVERDDELAALRDAIDRRMTVLVSGVPGVGKTSLLQAACEDRDGVLAAVCAPLDAEVPFNVLRAMLGRLARAAGPGEPPFDGPAETMQRIARNQPVEADSAHVAASLAWLLDQLDAPILLIDDAQWIDAASGGAIAAALRHVQCATLIGARPFDDDSWPLRGIAELVLQPAPLSVTGVRALLARLPARERLAVDAVKMTEMTGGIPLYVRAATVAARPSLGLRGREWATRGLRGLPQLEREIVTALAVLARPVPLPVLSRLVGGDLSHPLAALRAHELVSLDEGAWRLEVPLLAEAVLESLPSAESVELHTAAASALLEAGAPLAEVAAHLVRLPRLPEPWQRSLVAHAAAAAIDAGDAATARALATRLLAEELSPVLETGVRLTAARAMILQGAIDGAIDMLERGPAPGGREVSAALGQALLAAGAYDAAARRYRMAVEDALDEGDRSLARRFLGVQAVSEFMSSAVPRALQHPEAAAVLAQPHDTTDDFGLLSAHALAASYTATPEAAGAIVDRALAIATPKAGDAAVFLLTGAINATSRHSEGAALLEAVVADAVDRHLLLDEATARYCLGTIARRLPRSLLRCRSEPAASRSRAAPSRGSHRRRAWLRRCGSAPSRRPRSQRPIPRRRQCWPSARASCTRTSRWHRLSAGERWAERRRSPRATSSSRGASPRRSSQPDPVGIPPSAGSPPRSSASRAR